MLSGSWLIKNIGIIYLNINLIGFGNIDCGLMAKSIKYSDRLISLFDFSNLNDKFAISWLIR